LKKSSAFPFNYLDPSAQRVKNPSKEIPASYNFPACSAVIVSPVFSLSIIS
jgi:hypothetical protein